MRICKFKFKFKFKIFFIASYCINGQEIWTYDTYNQNFFSGALIRMADLFTWCKALVLCWISTVGAHSQSGNPSQPDFLKCILFIRQWHNAAQVWLTQNVNNNRSKGSVKPDKFYGLLLCYTLKVKQFRTKQGNIEKAEKKQQQQQKKI